MCSSRAGSPRRWSDLICLGGGGPADGQEQMQGAGPVFQLLPQAVSLFPFQSRQIDDAPKALSLITRNDRRETVLPPNKIIPGPVLIPRGDFQLLIPVVVQMQVELFQPPGIQRSPHYSTFVLFVA
jgi:hypothetical protein